MDFWDLTKLLFHRWYVTVPMLVITGVITVWTGATVQPDYIATAYVQLIPPTTPTTSNAANGTKVPTGPHNPWLDLGLGTLSNAAIVMVQDQKVIEEMDKAGYSGNFTITMSQQTPLVTIEVIGETGIQATETAKQLVQRFDASVKSLQDAYGAPRADQITTRRLDLGTNLEESNSKTKRALVAVLGAGMLMTVAATVGLDALLRRRARRRGTRGSGTGKRRGPPTIPAAGPPAPVPVSPAVSPSAPVPPDAERTAEVARRPAEDETDVDLTMAIVRPASRPAPPAPSTSTGAQSGLRVEYRELMGTAPSAEREVVEEPAEEHRPIPSDATIVLPMGLPREQWAAWDGEGKKRR